MLSPAEILGPKGRIAARLEHYEQRPEQPWSPRQVRCDGRVGDRQQDQITPHAAVFEEADVQSGTPAAVAFTPGTSAGQDDEHDADEPREEHCGFGDC